MPDDWQDEITPGSNVTRINRQPETPEEKRAKIRAGQTRGQTALAWVFVALLALAALGALVRLNVWLWFGR